MSATLRVLPQAAPLHGSVPVPSDRSITHRALILAALSNGPCAIRGFGYGGDNLVTLAALGALGVRHEDDGKGTLRVRGVGLNGLRAPAEALSAGHSATCLRLLSGVLCAQPFATELGGAPLLQEQPMASIVAPLNRRGARISGRSSAERPSEILPPLKFEALPAGQRLEAIEYALSGPNDHAKGALLLSGLFAAGPTMIIEPVLSRDHTERLLDALGMPVRAAGPVISLHPPQSPLAIPGFEFDVPGDISAAAFALVAAQIVPGSNVTTRRTGLNPTRSAVLEVIRLCGGAMGITPSGASLGEPFGDVNARGSRLRGIALAGELAHRALDEIPALCALLARSRGQSEISDCAELREGPRDRIAGLVALLGAFGVQAEARADGLVIEGQPEGPLRSARVASGGDHRLAMTAVLLGLMADGESFVDDADCLAVSFPRFVGTLRALGAKVEVMR
jgi:3-phosphoshikimate 1-carboxyvinyltransferase